MTPVAGASSRTAPRGTPRVRPGRPAAAVRGASLGIALAAGTAPGGVGAPARTAGRPATARPVPLGPPTTWPPGSGTHPSRGRNAPVGAPDASSSGGTGVVPVTPGTATATKPRTAAPVGPRLSRARSRVVPSSTPTLVLGSRTVQISTARETSQALGGAKMVTTGEPTAPR